MGTDLTHRLARSPAAPALSWGLRARYLARQEAERIGSGSRWLFKTREHTNFTYGLTARSWRYLSAFTAVVSGRSIGECDGYIREIISDEALQQHVKAATTAASRRRISDAECRVGRRAGWYTLVRALKPSHVVETGTDKGLGSLVLAAALLRNGHGRLTTIDINPESGFLIGGEYSQVVDRRVGSSTDIIDGLDGVDFFIHDSNHDPAFEMSEFVAVTPRLTQHALVLTDNSEASTSLLDWSLSQGRQFLDFREEPDVSALRAEGIGASWRSRE